jgi:uncharacterized membrane protein
MTTETGRVEAFSDGVFAIAITLLILNIKIPQGPEHTLARDLFQQWPSYLAFLLSFLFIGVMWLNHHRLFTHIRRADNMLLVLNLLLLLGATVVPFPTAVLASHLAGADAGTAAVFYNATYLVIATFFNVLWRYAVSHGLLDEVYSGESARAISRQYAYGPLLYLICVALSWASPILSLFLNGALAMFFAIPPRYAARIGAART